eukprot:Sspe_Gene.23421::Locus_9101_Transcript_1_1_Confidence_1.000_Length_4302::g.23421::m.23421
MQKEKSVETTQLLLKTPKGADWPGAKFEGAGGRFTVNKTSVVWVAAFHASTSTGEEVCQASAAWPVTVVPGEGCSMSVLKQPTRVRAGQEIVVQVGLRDKHDNTAYCNIQYATFRAPTSQSRLLDAREVRRDRDCRTLCEGTTRCTTWTFAVRTQSVRMERGEHRYEKGTCYLYSGLGVARRQGGLRSGVVGLLSCPRGVIQLTATRPDGGALEGRVRERESGGHGEVCLRGLPAEVLGTLERMDLEGCRRCCAEDGAEVEVRAKVEGEWRCGCKSEFEVGRYEEVGCGRRAEVRVRGTGTRVVRGVGGHVVSFKGLWHNKAERVLLRFENLAVPDCPGVEAAVIEVVPGRPHHLNLVRAPDLVYASACGPDEPFEVEFEIVDFWNNRNTEENSHDVRLVLVEGTGRLRGEMLVRARAGLATFVVGYAKAETIRLEAQDLALGEEAGSGVQVSAGEGGEEATGEGSGEDEDETEGAGAVGADEAAGEEAGAGAGAGAGTCWNSPCWKDSCRKATRKRCCARTGRIEVLSGPAYQLRVVKQPPAEVQSYAGGGARCSRTRWSCRTSAGTG